MNRKSKKTGPLIRLRIVYLDGIFANPAQYAGSQKVRLSFLLFLEIADCPSPKKRRWMPRLISPSKAGQVGFADEIKAWGGKRRA